MFSLIVVSHSSLLVVLLEKFDKTHKIYDKF